MILFTAIMEAYRNCTESWLVGLTKTEVPAKKLIFFHQDLLSVRVKLCLTHHWKILFLSAEQKWSEPYGGKSTPAMNHNRPHSMALGMRCLPHEGEHGQRVLWNTHVRPLGIMVLSYYTSTRPPFLGTLQQKDNSIQNVQPTLQRQVFVILLMYSMFPENYLYLVNTPQYYLALNIPLLKGNSKDQHFCLINLFIEWKKWTVTHRPLERHSERLRTLKR